VSLAKLMHCSAYLGITYRKRVQELVWRKRGQYFKCSSVRRLRYLDLSWSGRMLLRRGRLIQKLLSNEDMLIVLMQQINF